jgi:hypothetical protein
MVLCLSYEASCIQDLGSKTQITLPVGRRSVSRFIDYIKKLKFVLKINV